MAIITRYQTRENPETGVREPVYETDRRKRVKLDADGNPIRKVLGYRVEVYKTEPDGTKRRKTVGSYRLKGEAEDAEIAAKASIRAGTFEWEPVEAAPEPSVPTVKEACEIWIRLKGMEISQNALSAYEGVLRNHIAPEWGETPVTALTHDQIQTVVLDWATEVEGERKAKHPQTIARALVVLTGAMDRQMRAGVIPANPAAGIRKPSVHKGKKDVPTWSAEQVAQFFEAADAHPFAPAFYLGELEGMRRAEILGLRWQDIRGLDTDQAVASVVQTCVADQRNGGRALLQPKAKTRSSERAILLTEPTVRALRRHRDKQTFIRKAAGEVWQENDLVICNEVGEPIRPAWFTISTRRMVKDAGLPELTPHSLRHHAATRMLRAGVSPALAAAKLGHSDVGLVFAKYGHLVETDQSTANDAIIRAVARKA